MDLKALYMTFDGRIGRKPFWLGIMGLLAAAVVLSLAVVPPLASLSPGLGDIAGLLLSAALLYPGVALATKRLHDRDKPVALIWLFVVPGLAYQIADVLGLVVRTLVIQGQVALVPTPIGIVLGLLSLVTGIWALVTLGLRKGTTGPNTHGPDPRIAATQHANGRSAVTDHGF